MKFPREPFGITAVVVALAMGAIGFLPLFGAPGYEQSLAAGLVVPWATAIASSLEASRATARTPLASVTRGIVAGLTYAGIALVTALLHAARVGICELWGALLYFVLTAGIGALMGGAWGAVAGEYVRMFVRRRVVRRRRLAAIVFAMAAPLGGIALSLYRFYASAMIFAYDPFVGYFSGTPYDTVIDPGPALLTYRLGSGATLAALLLFASLLGRDDDGRLAIHLRRAPSSPLRAALAAIFALASVGVLLAGTALGHWSTPASIADDLGAAKHGPRCDVIYPSTTREQEANLLLKDCEEELSAVEARLGARGPARVRAYFFRDPADKKRLMGAAHTFIAKPWREEVYLQLSGYPHPVLGHELAHVVAGSFGRGPFRIAGSVGGLLPNPGLIEGIAVAASPDDEDLTDAQWAHAMKRIGILPSMSRVFSLGFLGDASAKSYTLAGAFIQWLGDRYGMDKVRRWYGGDDPATVFGKSLGDLDREFRDSLDAAVLPSEAEAFARAKFARPGVFGRKCPHLVDRLRHDADVCRDTQRFEEAVATYDRVLAKDETDFAALHARADVFRRHLDASRGVAELAKLADSTTVPRSWRDRADESLADADFIDGKLDAAGKRYDALAQRTVDEDAARTLEVKALATRIPAARASIQALLLGDGKHGADFYVAGVALGAWESAVSASTHPSALASYLVGRNMVQRGFYELGGASLDRAIAADAVDHELTPRIARETLRQRAIVACALSEGATLERIGAEIASPADPFRGAAGGRREATLRMIARCRGH